MSRRVKDENMQPVLIAEHLRMPDDLRVAHGIRIMKLRKQHKYSQERLAEVLGRSTSYISDVEHGRVFLNGEEYYAICKEFDTSMDYLFRNIVDSSATDEIYKALKDDFTGKEIDVIKRFCAYIQKL